jgi:hypothetical protein
LNIDEKELLDERYKDLYNYSLSEIENKYKKDMEDAEGDPKKIAILNSSLIFSKKFETPMHQHIDKETLRLMIRRFLIGDMSYSDPEARDYHDERVDIYNNYSRKVGSAFFSLDKRAIDWIIRQQKITNDINDAIIKILESEYNPDIDNWYIIQAKLHNAGIRYKESELDLITLKAINELLPMFEMELFIKQYKQNIKRIMKLWNANHKIYKDKTGGNIGEFLISGLDISEKLYTKNYDLINSEEKFFESISSYSGTFLDEITTHNVFVEGAAYE